MMLRRRDTLFHKVREKCEAKPRAGIGVLPSAPLARPLDAPPPCP
jgi:hypothetical protein